MRATSCPHCGYDLDGAMPVRDSVTCPECGRVWPWPLPAVQSRGERATRVAVALAAPPAVWAFALYVAVGTLWSQWQNKALGLSVALGVALVLASVIPWLVLPRQPRAGWAVRAALAALWTLSLAGGVLTCLFAWGMSRLGPSF